MIVGDGSLADGHLEVDGKIIYQMNDFSVRLADDEPTLRSESTSR